MGLGGRRRHGVDETAPIVRSTRKPPKVWATVTVNHDLLVVRLKGWRAIWAAKRTLRVPLSALIAVQRDPAAYVHIKTRLRGIRRARSTTFKLGAQHSMDGWSFWACGMARNAVVLETEGVRYRYIVAEVADPDSVVTMIRGAAGIEAPKHVQPPTVRSITESKRLRRDQPPGARPPRPAGTKSPAKISRIERPPSEGEAPGAHASASAPARIHMVEEPPGTHPEPAGGSGPTEEPDQT